jgi:hypothetical protein
MPTPSPCGEGVFACVGIRGGAAGPSVRATPRRVRPAPPARLPWHAYPSIIATASISTRNCGWASALMTTKVLAG